MKRISDCGLRIAVGRQWIEVSGQEPTVPMTISADRRASQFFVGHET